MRPVLGVKREISYYNSNQHGLFQLPRQRLYKLPHTSDYPTSEVNCICRLVSRTQLKVLNFTSTAHQHDDR